MSMRRVADLEGALAGSETDGDSMRRKRAQSFPIFGRDDVGCARKYSRARRCDDAGLERIWWVYFDGFGGSSFGVTLSSVDAMRTGRRGD